MSTRYCVLTGTDSSGNANWPCGPVSWTFVVLTKPCVYGNGLDCSTTWRLALPVPVSAPASTVGLPNGTGFGVAPSVSPSGWCLVLNVRSAPRVMPKLFCATSR